MLIDYLSTYSADLSTQRIRNVEVPHVDTPTLVDPTFSVDEQWLIIYRNKYFNSRKKYVLVEPEEGPTKRCGCENVRCSTTSTVGKCGYCGKPMRSACIEQGGFLGICRQCFIYHHCMERSKDGPAKRNESKFQIHLHFIYDS
jgi:hypothetical protein